MGWWGEGGRGEGRRGEGGGREGGGRGREGGRGKGAGGREGEGGGRGKGEGGKEGEGGGGKEGKGGRVARGFARTFWPQKILYTADLYIFSALPLVSDPLALLAAIENHRHPNEFGLQLAPHMAFVHAEDQRGTRARERAVYAAAMKGRARKYVCK